MKPAKNALRVISVRLAHHYQFRARLAQLELRRGCLTSHALAHALGPVTALKAPSFPSHAQRQRSHLSRGRRGLTHARIVRSGSTARRIQIIRLNATTSTARKVRQELLPSRLSSASAQQATWASKLMGRSRVCDARKEASATSLAPCLQTWKSRLATGV